MVNDNSLSDSVLIQISVLEKDIKGLEDILSHLEHSSESGMGYDRQIANIKNQIQQKTKQIQQFKRSINMNDAQAQLALIGITTDAVDPDEQFNAFIKKHGWPRSYEESKALLEKAKKEGIHPDYIHGMERGLKSMTHKDDDATEHGSIETYGKEKETETMPLEKDPVQAQDAMVYKDQKGNIWQVVENTGADFYGLKCTAGPRKGEKIYVKGKDLQSMQRMEDEEPMNGTTQDSDEETEDAYTPGSYDPKRHKENIMSLQNKLEGLLNSITRNKQRITILRTTVNSHKQGAGDLSELKEEERKLEANQMQMQQTLSMLKRATGQKDEESTNAVKDSYEMLKLCGIIS